MIISQLLSVRRGYIVHEEALSHNYFPSVADIQSTRETRDIGSDIAAVDSIYLSVGFSDGRHAADGIGDGGEGHRLLIGQWRVEQRVAADGLYSPQIGAAGVSPVSV